MTSTLPSHDAAAGGVARGCQCLRPLRDDDSCLRCGRWVPEADAEGTPRRSRCEDNPWTAAGVIRALRAHEFFVGRPPTPADWGPHDDDETPGTVTVASLFGSFEGALQATGLTAARRAA